MSKKKTGIIVAIVVVVIAAVAVGLWFLLRGNFGGSNNGDKVYVESVESLTKVNMGVQNRYSGVVEPQKSWDIKKNPEKTVKEVFVKEGDTVEEGTPLFEYDTESIKDEIAQAKLELEGIDNQIADYYNQIKTLKNERASVSEDEKFQYTTQIQTIETSIKQAEYNKESKQVEIQKKEESLNFAVVTSEIAGIIKSISENGYDPYTGQELPFMTVLAVGDYRVKGTVNEMNVASIPVGSQVLLRSRVNEEQTWTGTITEVDTNREADSNNNNGMYYDGGGGETATKYPFYIELDSTDGLILGQHLYIELDMGQMEVKEGVWLYETYIMMEEGGNYVWADNGRNRLEKREIELGDYDADMMSYQIVSGLTEEDYIAYPMNYLYEGVPTVTDEAEVDYTSPMYQEDGMMNGNDMMDGDGMEDGMMGGDDMMGIDGAEDNMMGGEGLEDNMMDGGGMEDGMMDGEGAEDGIIPEGDAANVPEDGAGTDADAPIE